LVLLIAVLAVDVAAVRKRHCAAAVSQQCQQWVSSKSAVASSLQRALKPAMHILNKVFDTNIALSPSFVTVVDYSSSYEPTRHLFCIFCPFGCG